MDKMFVFLVIALFTNGAFGQGQQQPNGENENVNIENRMMMSLARAQRQMDNGQNQFPTASPNTVTTTTPANTIPTTQSALVRQCIINCPVTPEYNPVCGTNSVTYDNPGKLTCAQMCGVSVALLRTSRCPAPAPVDPQ